MPWTGPQSSKREIVILHMRAGRGVAAIPSYRRPSTHPGECAPARLHATAASYLIRYVIARNHGCSPSPLVASSREGAHGMHPVPALRAMSMRAGSYLASMGMPTYTCTYMVTLITSMLLRIRWLW